MKSKLFAIVRVNPVYGCTNRFDTIEEAVEAAKRSILKSRDNGPYYITQAVQLVRAVEPVIEVVPVRASE